MAKNSINDIAVFVARKQKISKKEAVDLVTAFFNTIAEGLRDDRQVKVRGLGTFKVTAVKARESVNVNTGERVIIEGHDKVSFVPDASMKELVNKPFAQFTTVVVNDGVSFDSIDAASAAEERKTTATESQPEPEQEIDSEPEQEIDSESEQELDSELELNDDEEEEVGSDDVAKEITSESTIIDSHVDDEEEPADSNQVLKETEESEPEPESEQQKPVENTQYAPAEQSEEEEKATPIPAPASDDKAPNVSREYFDEQMSACRRRCNRNLILSIVLLVVGLVAGFLIGHYLDAPQVATEQPTKDTTMVAKAAQPVNKPVETPAVKDSTPAVDTTKTVAQEDNKAKEEVEKPAEKPEENIEDDITPDMKKLNSDRRLRFGAYEIVGIDKVITLKKGQTMQSYSNKTLGKDMVVYFQVLNGKDDVKPGEKLKVPKIRLKKKFRK